MGCSELILNKPQRITQQTRYIERMLIHRLRLFYTSHLLKGNVERITAVK